MNNYREKPLQFAWDCVKQCPILLSQFVLGAFIWSLTRVLGSYYIKEVVDVFLAAPSPDQLTWQAVLPVFLGFFFLGYVLRDAINPFLSNLTRILMFKKVKNLIRIESFQHTITQSFSFLENKMSGSLANKIMDLQSHTEQVVKIIVNGFFGVISYIVIFLVITYFISPLFVWLMLAWSVL